MSKKEHRGVIAITSNTGHLWWVANARCICLYPILLGLHTAIADRRVSTTYRLQSNARLRLLLLLLLRLGAVNVTSLQFALRRLK